MPVVVPLTDEPRDLLLGPDNDLVITSDASFVRGIDAVAQSCQIAMQMFQGEWFADLDVGVPYWQAILGAKPRTAQGAARVTLRKILLAVPGVLDVTKLDVTRDPDTRGLNVTWAVRTARGDTPDNVLAFGGAS